MDLKTFLKGFDSEAAREDFAVKCGTSLGHLRNVSYGIRACAPELAVSIERESEGSVTRPDLRVDDWHRIWPELIGAPGAPQVAPEHEPDPLES